MKRTSISTLNYLKKECSKSLAFGVALLLVITLYVTILGTLLTKKDQAPTKKVATTKIFIGPRSDALSSSEWPTNNLKLEVKAKPNYQASNNSASKASASIKIASNNRVAKN